MHFRYLFFLLTVPLILPSCKSAINDAVRETKYSAYEMIGMEKRDLFKREVKNVKEDQKDTGESFENALEKLKAVYNYDGGNLERRYRSLDSSYQSAERKAAEARQSIAQVETVAQDLFNEWNNELKEMKSADLRSKSSSQLYETQKKYNDFHSALKRSEAKIAPVLAQLKDHVVFLKHNLNAQAITGLKKESVRIQNDIESLMNEMNSSIQKADEFIKTM